MLTARVQRLKDVTVIHCAGRIAFPHASELWATVFRHTRAQALVLDLADVLAIDAAGLGMLVSLRAWAKRTRTELKLMNVSPRVEQLLGLTRLKSEFEVCSAWEMLDLLCRALQKDGSAGLLAVRDTGSNDQTSTSAHP
jgi:anti-sigma B factor antagonist